MSACSCPCGLTGSTFLRVKNPLKEVSRRTGPNLEVRQSVRVRALTFSTAVERLEIIEGVADMNYITTVFLTGTGVLFVAVPG
jgi:hypothetical protein